VHTNLRSGSVLLSGLLAAAPAWAEPSRGFQLAAQTPHFLFYSRNGETIDVHEVERTLWKVQRLLGQELPGPAEYYRYGTPQEVAADLGEYATGVTLGSLRQIHTVRRECHLHEIVHLVAAQLGDPGPFFQEGLAVALSGSKWRGQALSGHRLPASLRRQKISTLAARFETLPPDGRVSGRGLVRVLPDQVVRRVPRRGVLSRLRPLRSAEGRGLPATFGEGLDQAGAAWARPQPQAGIAATTAVVLCQPSRRPLKRAISP
jgi:hypothetical protein